MGGVETTGPTAASLERMMAELSETVKEAKRLSETVHSQLTGESHARVVDKGEPKDPSPGLLPQMASAIHSVSDDAGSIVSILQNLRHKLDNQEVPSRVEH